MKIFAIGDLHLGHAVDKPMDVFGPVWKDHARRIQASWERTVGPSDLVLVPGDLSWAMRLEEAEEDLRWLDNLPGRKLVIKGNHDYWWAAISRLRRRLRGSSIYALQYDAVCMGSVAVGGTRLWNLPGMAESYVDPLADTPQGVPETDQGLDAAEEARARDEKIFLRELGRLERSLQSMKADAALRIVMTHFPPTDTTGRETPVTRLLHRYGAHLCVFGHLHSLGFAEGRSWDFHSNGVRYVLVSCDAVGFAPYWLTEVPDAVDPFPW